MNRRVLVMDLGDASKRLGTRLDGFLCERREAARLPSMPTREHIQYEEPPE